MHGFGSPYSSKVLFYSPYKYTPAKTSLMSSDFPQFCFSPDPSSSSTKLSSPLARRRIDMDNVDNFFPESIANTEFDGIVEDCFTSNEAPTCFLEDEDSLNKTPAKSDSSSGEGKKFGSSQSNGSIGICFGELQFSSSLKQINKRINLQSQTTKTDARLLETQYFKETKEGTNFSPSKLTQSQTDEEIHGSDGSHAKMEDEKSRNMSPMCSVNNNSDQVFVK